MFKSSDQIPTITVTTNGPYVVEGNVSICKSDGTTLQSKGRRYLCRCGGSRNKPFCDASHGMKTFEGTETSDRHLQPGRRQSYVGVGITVYDDRKRCAHFGQCTSRLPDAFRATEEPFVRAEAADSANLEVVVSACPSGALSYSLGDDAQTVEASASPSIVPLTDGPYQVRGNVQVISADGEPYEARERQTLCRCGQSGNKPFCDGSHWYAGFRDPLPRELAKGPPSLFDWLGGLDPLERLTKRFYEKILSEPDPILEPIFRGMDAAHPKHVAAWLGETFGGPPIYTRKHGGYEHMVSKHRNLGLTEPQRQRWVGRMVETADEVDLPNDPDFRSALVAYLEWGTRIAVMNSQPGAAVIEHAPVPRWGWGESPPFEPQPWDAADAAEQGRRRYAAEHHAAAPRDGANL